MTDSHITNVRAVPGAQQAGSHGSRDWGEALRTLSQVAVTLGSERIATEANDLAQRVAEGRFFVACVGQFKRGKSTLMNALVGEAILPSGVLPVTTVPTVVRYGERPSARIRIQGNWSEIATSELEQYISEEHNPENTKGIEGVEVFVPGLLLRSGMCFVDTPGLGSVFTGNTAATQAFIPHIDAAIAVVGADPPISGDELTLIEAVAQHVSHILVVLNKADRVTDMERAAATAFARRMLEKRLHRAVGEIFEVSAIERLENRGPERDWSGLLDALQRLVLESGRDLTQRAGERGFVRLSEQGLTIIDEERQALLRPIEESEQRISAMRATLADAERSMRDLSYLFTAEQQRLHDLFLTRRKDFLRKVGPLAQASLQEWLRKTSRSFGPSFRRQLMHEAQQVARGHVLPWLSGEQEHAERAYREAMLRFVDLANEFLRRLSETGVPELARMPHAIDAERGFRARSRFYFEDFINLAQPASPLRFLADVFLGMVGSSGPIQRAGEQFLEWLLEANSSRVQGDVDERVADSRSGLEADIRILLREISAAAERALSNAKMARAEGSMAVQAALERLANLEREITEMRQAA
jgi:GTP-binding protein EngB required for normal cell division